MPANIKRLILIILFSFLVIGGIIYFTATEETWTSIKNMDRRFLLLGLLFYIIMYTLDVSRTYILIRGTGHKINFFEVYRIIAVQVFFDLLTPFSFGGQPFQVYILHKKKVPGGSAVTVVMTKLIFGGLVITSIVVWGIFAHSELFQGSYGRFTQHMIEIVGALLLIGIALFVTGLYNPKITTGILTLFFKLLWKLKLVRHPDKFKTKIMKHILLARNSFDGFMGHRFFYFLTGLIISYIQFLSLIFMVMFFMWGLGVAIPVKIGIALIGTLLFLIALMPTPGASGLGEGIFVFLFNDHFGEKMYLLGVVIFLWRFFHQYLTAFLGAIVTGQYGAELLSKKIGKIKSK